MFKTAISSKVMQGFALQEIIDYAAAVGFHGVELWMHQVEESGLSTCQLKKILAAAGLTCQIHVDTRDVNIASANCLIREVSVRQIMAAIEYASDLEVSVVTVHPGRFTSEKEYFSPEHVWNIQLEALKMLARQAEKNGVVIGLENMEKRSKEFVLTESDMARIIDAVGSESFGATLDIAHLHSAGDVYSAVSAWQLPIVNVHISQSNDKMHLPIYSTEAGVIDYSKVLPVIVDKYSGFLVVEGYIRGMEKDNVRKSFEWLVAHGVA